MYMYIYVYIYPYIHAYPYPYVLHAFTRSLVLRMLLGASPDRGVALIRGDPSRAEVSEPPGRRARTYVCMYVCMYIHIYIYIYIYVHT